MVGCGLIGEDDIDSGDDDDEEEEEDENEIDAVLDLVRLFSDLSYTFITSCALKTTSYKISAVIFKCRT